MKCFISGNNKSLEECEVEVFPGSAGEMRQLRVYSDVEFQEFLGMGGAFTEASAWVWSRVSKEKQNELVNLYFGENGAGYNFCRTHIQSCDFALGNYAYEKDSEDKDLKSFDMSQDEKYILPLINAALERNNSIEFLSSPWSPPAFMKSNGEMNHGGKLLPEYYEMWADMMSKYVLEMKKRGVNVTRLTVQNEPEATQTWDSCRYIAQEERDFAVEYLRPALDRAGLSDVKINVWDHNKEIVLDRARECLNSEKAKDSISGVAFHWYSGDHFEELAQLTREFPGKELIFTEGCVEFSRFAKDAQIPHAEMYAHDIIGNFNAGANAFIDWNMFLNFEGGPNHVGNFCSAPVMVDVGGVNDENGSGEIKINKSFYYISHFSRFIKKGAKRILTSRYSSKIESVAFKNPDGKIVIVVLNSSDNEEAFTLYCNNSHADIKLEAHSIATICM